ncbi:hypothetical protein [Marivita hallyeonensis]|uniref:Uncharacterized protein n=1 Tax=Marivita hallyeonensis TaxID=996342 RepID=A0A1M5N9V8_9RHOB|nr:hypothetical protein [Marivita hallyeonensis]SHG86288.1 hypothetical protein SAMN05443551_0826 [Marivita hallyeonensis]
MTRRDMMPAGMGVIMGAMMLWMLHGFLTGDGSAAGAVAFVLAHVAVVSAALAAVAFGLHRRWPALARILAHRPSRRHVGVMFGMAVATAVLIHLVHGGPAWT